MAENSDRWSGSMKDRAAELPTHGAVGLHVLPNAGHWVQVDNPDGLLEIIGRHLR